MSIHQLKGNWRTKEVWLDEKPLSPARSQKVWNHSPDGFNWSYGGSGPAQLALAVLLELMDTKDAVAKHQEFKCKVISKLLPEDVNLCFNLQGLYSAENSTTNPEKVMRALEI